MFYTMAKETFKLNEAQLKNIVRETIKTALDEGMYPNHPYIEKWFQIQDLLDAKTILTALFEYLPVDTLVDFIDTLDREYELGLNDEEEEDDEE